MGASVRPVDDSGRIRANVAKMRSMGAPDGDVEHYLQSEGFKPVQPEGRAPLPPRDGFGQRVLDGVTGGVKQLVTHPIESAKAMGRAALTDLSTIGENMNGGMGQPNQNTPETARALPGALARTGTALAFPGVAGGVAAKLGGGMLARGAGMATAGGLAGAANNPNDPLVGAATGAALGVAVPGSLGAVGRVARATGVPSLVANALPRPTSRAALPARMGMQTAGDLAQADVLKQLGRSRMPLGELEAKAASAHPDQMLMDVAGQPMVDRAGGAVATPSTGSADIVKALDARAQRAPKAVRGAASDALGVKRENTVTTEQRMVGERSAASDDAFGALREKYGTPQKIDGLDALVGRPSFDTAVRESEAILKESPTGLSSPLEQTITEKVNGKNVKRTVIRPLSFDEAHTLKMAHDDVAKMAAPVPVDAGGVTKTRVGKQKNTHAELMDHLTGTFDGYPEALEQHATASKALTAHELGQSFMRAKTDDLAAMWPDMAEAERAAYRKGAIASVEDAVRGKTDGQNPVRDFRDDIMRDNLDIIMPTKEAAQQFSDRVDQFHQMHSTRAQIVGNSKTASRLAQMEESAGGTAGDIMHAATHGPMSLLGKVANNALTRRIRGLSEAQVNALAPLLTAHGPELAQVIEELKAFQAKQGARHPLPSRALAQAAVTANAKP